MDEVNRIDREKRYVVFKSEFVGGNKILIVYEYSLNLCSQWLKCRQNQASLTMKMKTVSQVSKKNQDPLMSRMCLLMC